MRDKVFILDGFTVLQKVRTGKVNYIVINTKKRYDEGHTHLSNMNEVRIVARNVSNKRIPRDVSRYILRSLIRLTDDEKYAEKVQELIDVRNKKGAKSKYVNQGGRKR